MTGFVRRAVFTTLLVLASTAAGAGASKAPVSAPRFALPGRVGAVALDSLRGRVVLVDFWASWCAPCHRSFPWLATMTRRYGAQGLTVVAVNLDKERAAADAFLADVEAPFPVAFDPGGATAEAYHVHAMPSSYLVARDGSIAWSHAGFDAKGAQAAEAAIRAACAR